MRLSVCGSVMPGGYPGAAGFLQAKKTRHIGGLGMEVGVGLTLKYQMLHIN
jgi:hypothetical protein